MSRFSNLGPRRRDPANRLVVLGGKTPARAQGTVWLVGAGPGDPDLLTIKALRLLGQADVIVHDGLVPDEILSLASPSARRIDVAKRKSRHTLPQDEINRLLVAFALDGLTVVRLKGGDPFVFGRGGEELDACHAAGVPTRVLPGVTSAIAAPGLAGIPVTHRGVTQGFTVVSGHVPPGHPDSTVDWSALARTGTTIVVLMGVRTLPAIAAALVEGGLEATTPAAVVADAGRSSQQVVRGTVSTIDTLAREAGIGAPAVVVVGAVAALGAEAVRDVQVAHA